MTIDDVPETYVDAEDMASEAEGDSSPEDIPEEGVPTAEEAAALEAAAEKPAEPPKEEPKPDVSTKRFVELAKRERRLVETERAIKDREAKAKAFEDARARVEADPAAALELLGLDVDKLVTALVQKDAPLTAEQRLERLEAERRSEREANERARMQAEERSASEQVQAIRAQVREFVSKDAEKYELIVAEDASDRVFEVMAEHYATTNQLLAFDKAAEMVEDFLFDRAKQVATKSKKVAALFHPAPPKAPALPPPTRDSTPGERLAAMLSGKTIAPTISNARGAIVSPPKPKTPRFVSREEAIESLVSKFKNGAP
jgi:hypothetical protein